MSRQHWHFAIRLSGRTKVAWRGQPWLKLNHITIQEGQTLPIGWVRVAESHNYGWVWLLAHWAKGEDEPWYLVSNRAASSIQLIRMYQRRMWIEETFGDLKRNGFDLESTHLRNFLRLSRLTLAVVLLYVWLLSSSLKVVLQM